MAKRVFVIHGWEGYLEEGWRPWLKKELEGKGFEVIIPAMPDTATPIFDKWLPYLAQTVGAADENTYFVCHSLGCITTLRYLETLEENQKIGGVVFVAGFGRDLEYEGYKGELTTFFATPVDWNKIKNACKKFVVIHSDDDEWVPPKFGEELAKNLESPFILEHGMKHFSSEDGITKAPIILEKFLEIVK
ncbi:serine hydrolase family protein [Candidatus Woesebacteria bacterium]|nr:serine hydrolase family protein [Candidatus Woesebacteria bacterium]